MSDPIIEAAARALRKEPILFDYPPDECLEIVRVVLAAVTPLIRAAALEEAAVVAEEVSSGQTVTRKKIAFRIRALIPSDPRA
ncbi:MAG: hypothetical protein AAAC47_11280 [Pararhizobium sp.]